MYYFFLALLPEVSSYVSRRSLFLLRRFKDCGVLLHIPLTLGEGCEEFDEPDEHGVGQETNFALTISSMEAM